MAEFDEVIKQGADNAANLLATMEKIPIAGEKSVAVFSRLASLIKGTSQGGGTEANRSSGYNYQSGGGDGGAPMGAPGGPKNPLAQMETTPIADVRSERFQGIVQGIVGDAFEMGLKTVSSIAMSLPTPNEALYTALMGERLRFYGARSTSGKPLRGLFGPNGAFRLQEQFAQVGTPNNPLDAVYAANAAAGVGLLPGLKNFSSGLREFGGVLGGAALASNLTPGLGLVGGVQTMGALNQARRVNMLRMIGVSVRNIGGTQMKDLPDIIEQLYNILRHANGGKNPTAEDIAISAQSGNALDSLLNQFFGDDANLRQVIISGLMQMVNTKGMNLKTSGRPANMQKTGGSIAAVRSLATTDTAELKFIQSFTERTLAGVQVGNKLLREYYEKLGSFSNKKGSIGGNISDIAGVLSAIETIGGARNGAGQLFVSSLLNNDLFTAIGIATLLTDIGIGILDGSGLTNIGGLSGRFLSQADEETRKGGGLNSFSNSWAQDWLSDSFAGYIKNQGPNPLTSFSSTPMAAPSATSRAMSGSIVINAYANTSTDPVVMGAALAKELSNQSAMTGAMF